MAFCLYKNTKIRGKWNSLFALAQKSSLSKTLRGRKGL